ncbi:MAG: hypothetical protein ABSB82_21965 [Terriglobia bacterium]|jgi:hypothetical protein
MKKDPERRVESSSFRIHHSAFVELLTAAFLVLHQIARGAGTARINRLVAFLDVLNNSVFVDHERGAIGKPLFVIQDAIVFGDCSLKVTQQGECQAILLGENFVGRWTVYTHAKNLRTGFLEMGDISLIRLELLRSTSGKSEDVKRQHQILLPQIIAQLHGLPIGVEQREIRGLVAHLQLRRRRRERRRERQHQ